MRSSPPRFLPPTLLAAFLVASAAALTAAGCGSTNRCSATTCVGCCDSDGVCQQGATNASCGVSGALCQTCTFEQFCQAGVCLASSTTSGNNDGGGADGGTPDGGGGEDGGEPDAGEGDGGQADGGEGDGGAGDGGSTDGGGSDGGSPDGGGMGDGGLDGGAPILDIQSFCGELDRANCEEGVRCGYVHSVQTCVAELGAGGLCYADHQAAAKDGRLTFDGAKARKCMDFIGKTRGCNDIYLRLTDLSADCRDMFFGNVPNGGACYIDAECAANSYCTTSSGACPGTCQPRKGAGQLATGYNSCLPGLYAYGGDSTCRAYVSPGASCAPLGGTQNQSCVPGYYCSSATLTCQAQVQQGAACTDLDQCVYPSYCSNGACMLLSPVGVSCGVTYCQHDLACQYLTSTATCAVRQPVGGTCFFDQNCTFNTRCIGANFGANVKGTCQPKKTAGQPCGSYFDCAYPGFYCSSPSGGTCFAQKGLGAPCSSSDECTSYSCTNGVCTTNSSCFDPTP